MDIYTLDGSFRNNQIIDRYESFIWTERFNSHGDFELILPGDGGDSAKLALGSFISIDDSLRVMKVETSERITDEDGSVKRKLTGRSLEAVILESRVAMSIHASIGAGFNKWRYGGRPLSAISEFYRILLIENPLYTADLIPELSSMWQSSLPLPTGDIPFPDETYSFELDSQNMYETIKLICETFNLGFRILKDPQHEQIHFSVYTGFDRTTGQSNNPPVIFSQSLENVLKTTELESISNLYNVAYVFAQNGVAVVYGNGFNSSVSGIERRVLRVMAEDLDIPAGSTLNLAMQRKGLEALGQHRSFSGFDGEISQNSSYAYGVDYQLGDLVEIKNDRGWSSHVRVTEQIFVSDAEGDRQYPTLTTELTITPGTWLGWPPSEEWVDVSDNWSDV